MADIINFNKARKRRDRDAAQAKAAENRVRFGRTAAQKARDTETEAEAARRLEGLRRETSESGESDPVEDEPLKPR